MKISIITPSYNQAQFIERTILSVIMQSWDFEIEYIIMDWWSTDWTLEIIKKYDDLIKNWKLKIKNKWIDFIWKSEKDKWQSDAINKGLKLSCWDIVTYLNSDDTYLSWNLDLVVKYLWNSEKKWCYGKCIIIDKDDKEIRKWITFYKNFMGKKYSYAKILSENFISQMTVFWKREILDEVWYFNENEHLCMDYEYWLRIWQKYDPIYIPEYLSNFRFYHTSKSWSMFSKQFWDEFRLAKKYSEWKYKFSLILHKFNYYKIIIIYEFLNILKK